MPLILASLCHSDCELQGICIEQTPSQMIPFSRVSYYISTRHHLWSFAWCFSRDKDFICLVKPTPTCKFYSCSLHLCRYFQIFFFLSFPPAQAILETSKSMNFGKHPAGKSPFIQGRFLLLLLLLSTMQQMLSRMGCLLGVWFEVPIPGGTFPRNCSGLRSDPSSIFLAEKKWTCFTDNWLHKALKNYSYFYHTKSKWVFVHMLFTTSLRSYGCYDFVTHRYRHSCI